MKITVLNGTPSGSGGSLNDYLKDLKNMLEKDKTTVRQFDLAGMDIRYCVGCFNCWLKTPGVCAIKDNMEKVLQEAVDSDLLIFAAPLSMGFIHSILKRSIERIIPLILPYISLYKGEMHHLIRYDRLPDLGVIVEKEKDTDARDIEINRYTFERLQYNFRSNLRFFFTTDQGAQEVKNEIMHT